MLWIPLLIVDEVGYIPFDPQAANLMFSLVSSRYERASLIVTSNKPFSGWGEIFGDEVVAAAMIDRLVHHAEIISLKGDSYRLRDRDLGGRPPATSARIGLTIIFRAALDRSSERLSATRSRPAELKNGPERPDLGRACTAPDPRLERSVRRAL